jgi:fatty-acyl-CoA synthase
MLSYARGKDAPISDRTIGQALGHTARSYPNELALVVRHQNIRLTWAQLLHSAERTASGLAGLGLVPGDRVGIWATNCGEWILVQLGAALAGVVLVNVNPSYRSHELAFVLRRSGIKAIFLREKDARANYRQILDEAAAGQELPLRHIVTLGTDDWTNMLANGTAYNASGVSNHDVTNIQYTSGTTGSPKGVLLTHRNLVNNAILTQQQLNLTVKDRLCAPLPMYHCFGCVLASLTCVVTGAALILPSPQYDALATLQALQDERATVIYGVPTMFIAELNHPDFPSFDLTSLRTGIMAGAPCPVEVMKRVSTEMHAHQMLIGYGLTETSPLVTMTKCDDPLELRVSTVGCAVANTEIKIVSRETGETVPTGEPGELCARGYAVMKGYDQEEEATRKAIDAEGWFHSGDLATMDANGYFRITGRAKDMIIRGGENIYPREVEEFLYQHPKIADVQVVGLPDERLGEIVACWIKLKAGEDCTCEEVRSFCHDKIAHFKIPHVIRFVESFPMTVTGKIQKFKIREEEMRAQTH